ncbi:CopD family protein [Luteimonas marina]|uniref:Protoporphyrinogen IX oxidase n=1 Tax=Luteimonas marina TaxID=488485 RepID=A0A5C5TUB4_9GAMM|nr:CopD family protein [Luteimonas marina]TWT17803.1 CopD family protein [Luteimonas marina]
MNAYVWTKSAHLLFVMAWVAAAFYLPRILINLAEAGDEPAVRARLVLMGRRLYRFGHVMFGFAALLGLALWLHFGVAGGWLHAKLALVALLLAHYVVGGRWLKGLDRGRALPSAKALRIFNEVPVFVLLGVIWLVLAKPF